MQKMFNFIYDAEHRLNDLNLIIRGIDREAADIYRDWKYNLHRAYKNNVQIGGIVRVRQQKPRAVYTMDQWQLTCDLFESVAYKVSEISIHIIFFILKLFLLIFCLYITYYKWHSEANTENMKEMEFPST